MCFATQKSTAMPWLSHTFFCQEGKRSEQLPTMNPNSLALRTISTVTPPGGSPNSMVPSMSKLMRKANFVLLALAQRQHGFHRSHLISAFRNHPLALPHGESDEQRAIDWLPQLPTPLSPDSVTSSTNIGVPSCSSRRHGTVEPRV